MCQQSYRQCKTGQEREQNCIEKAEGENGDESNDKKKACTATRMESAVVYYSIRDKCTFQFIREYRFMLGAVITKKLLNIFHQ